MAIRRINSTGRKKIMRADASIRVRPDSDGVPLFDAALSLTAYRLPNEAHVFVEAYRQTTLMRFPHGTVADSAPPPPAERRLTEFASPEGLLFRVKVTSTGGRIGLLLAEADRIPLSGDVEQPDNRIPLLPPLGQDLGHETWRVDFSGANGPLLLVNRRLGDWKGVAASPLFRSLVYPAAMREVLWYVYKIEGTQAMDDLQDWRCRWLQFAAALPGSRNPPLTSEDDSEWEEWISDAVESFARRHELLDRYREMLNAEAAS